MKKIIISSVFIFGFWMSLFAQTAKKVNEGAVVAMDNPAISNGNLDEEKVKKEAVLTSEAVIMENQVVNQDLEEKKKYLEEKRSAIQSDKSVPEKDKQKQLAELDKISREAGIAVPKKKNQPVKKIKTGK